MNGQTPGKMICSLRVLTDQRAADQRHCRPCCGICCGPPTCFLGIWPGGDGAEPQVSAAGRSGCGHDRRRRRSAVADGRGQARRSAGHSARRLSAAEFCRQRSMAKALATYVERRRFFSTPRRREVAQHLAEPLLDRFGLPADTSYDLLLCALYYRTFIADRSQDERMLAEAQAAFAQANPFVAYMNTSQPYQLSQYPGGPPAWHRLSTTCPAAATAAGAVGGRGQFRTGEIARSDKQPACRRARSTSRQAGSLPYDHESRRSPRTPPPELARAGAPLRPASGGTRTPKLPPARCSRFGALYRAACADLALAYAYQLPQNTVQYLHRLVGRAHNQLYRSRRFEFAKWADMLLFDVPQHDLSTTAACSSCSACSGACSSSSAWLAYSKTAWPDFAEQVLSARGNRAAGGNVQKPDRRQPARRRRKRDHDGASISTTTPASACSALPGVCSSCRACSMHDVQRDRARRRRSATWPARMCPKGRTSFTSSRPTVRSS